MLTALTLSVASIVASGDVLTNNGVLDLVERGLSGTLIIAMIENSHTEFDTSMDALLSLRAKSVPDKVLEAMLNTKGPHDLSHDGRLMVYVTDSDSWETSGGFVFNESGGGGYSSGGARPQTAEIIKTFRERCPEIAVTNERERADYVVLLDHEGGKSFLQRDNKVAVFGRDGTSIYSGSTRTLGNAVKDACREIQRLETEQEPSHQG